MGSRFVNTARRIPMSRINISLTPDVQYASDTARIGQIAQKWRATGAGIDTCHATMGRGWKACADQLADLLIDPPGSQEP